jgi:hypothetical protein
MSKNTTTHLVLDELSPIDRYRKVSVQYAAEYNDLSEDAFRRNYSHLIRRVGKRKQAVTVADMILLPPP